MALTQQRETHHTAHAVEVEIQQDQIDVRIRFAQGEGFIASVSGKRCEETTAPRNAVLLLRHDLLSVQSPACVRRLRALSQPRDHDARSSAAVFAGICRRGTSTVCAKQPRWTSTKGPSAMAAPDGSPEQPGRLVEDRRPPIRYLLAWRSVHGAELAAGSLRLQV